MIDIEVCRLGVENMSFLADKWKGILLCLILAIPCYLLGKVFPMVGGPIFAIILGIIIGSFYKNRYNTEQGIGFVSKKVLQYAVIFLGFGLNIMEVVHVGFTSLPVIISTIGTSLLVAYVLYKIMHIDSQAAILVGVGSSICGGSAIAATAPVIKADAHKIAQAISVVFFFNVIAAFVFPSLGDWLGLSNLGFGLFAGTAVNDTSSVTATAAIWDEMHEGAHALEYATIVKLTRTCAIIPITLALAAYEVWKAKRENRVDQENAVKIAKIFPRFIIYFILASVITTICLYFGASREVFAPLKEASKFMIVMAMMAIGLNTDIIKLIKSGGKVLLLGLCCWVAISGVSLYVQHLIGQL